VKNEHEFTVTEVLISKYLAGEADATEADELHTWLQQPANYAYFQEAERAWHTAHPSKSPKAIDRGQAWKKIEDHILQSHGAKSLPLYPLKPKNVSMKVAASIVIVATIALLLYTRFRPATETEYVVRTGDNVQRIDLPDQSKAVIYKGTELSYTSHGDVPTRKVNLRAGEVFFQVKKDVRKPFIIHTDIGDIRVLGTSFNVKLVNNTLEVGVREGKVLLYTQQDSLTLTAGTTGTIKPDQSLDAVNTVKPNGWGYATHQFVYKDASLQEVLADFEKAYNCTIRTEGGAISRCRLTATFENDSARNLLDLIAESLNLSVTNHDGVFVLEGEGCP
jgi:ferric-dicitrate binding protein FerR (iron transport regulator)